MTDLDMLIGRAQRNISAATLALVGGVVVALLFLPLFTPDPIDPTVEKLLYLILGALVSTLSSQNQFWFGRPRNAGVPDPASSGSAGPIANVEHMNVEATPKPTEEPPHENP